MKKISILIIITILSSSCKEETGKEMIEQFAIDLFNNQIKPETIVEKYIYISKELDTKIPYKKRKQGYAELIKETRAGKGIDGVWVYPNIRLKAIKTPRAYLYEEYNNLSTVKINNIETIKDRVYVILNTKKTKILAYILLNETKNKILSLSLLGKDNTAYFIQL